MSHLSFAPYRLQRYSSETLIEVFRNLPATITSLDIGNNTLGRRPAFELAEALKKIPASVKCLNLFGNYLHEKSLEELELIFSALPQKLERLILDGNQLWGKNASVALKKLPTSLKSLSLSEISFSFLENDITGLSEEQIQLTLNAIPKTIHELDLKGLELGLLSEEKLQIFLEALPPELKHLGLSFTSLNHRSIDSLIQLFHTLPITLRSLNLGANDLNRYTIEELERLFSHLPTTLESLDLSNIEWGKMEAENIIRMLQSLPHSIKNLKLNSIHIQSLTEEQLSLIFQSIPAQIQHLDLSHNPFNTFSSTKIALAFNQLSPTLRTLKLNECQLEQCSKEDLALILHSLPSTLESLSLEKNRLGQKTAEELISLASHLPAGLKLLDISDNEFEQSRIFPHRIMIRNFESDSEIIDEDEEIDKMPLCKLSLFIASLPHDIQHIHINRKAFFSTVPDECHQGMQLFLHNTFPRVILKDAPLDATPYIHSTQQLFQEKNIPQELAPTILSYLSSASYQDIVRTVYSQNHVPITLLSELSLWARTQMRGSNEAVKKQVQLLAPLYRQLKSFEPHPMFGWGIQLMAFATYELLQKHITPRQYLNIADGIKSALSHHEEITEICELMRNMVYNEHIREEDYLVNFLSGAPLRLEL